MKRLSKKSALMFSVIEQGQWVTNRQLAEFAECAKGSAARFTSALEKLRVVERLNCRPEPLYKLSQGEFSAEGKEWIEGLQQLREAIELGTEN